MPLYFCKQNTVLAVHSDDQIYLDPTVAYGPNTYVVADFNGPAPKTDPPINTAPSGLGAGPLPPPPVVGQFVYPTITPKIQADSVKLECRRRITTKISEQSQRNLTTYITDIQNRAIMSIGGTPPTPAEQSDIATAHAIWAWIGRPSGMQAASDAMIAAFDLEWYQDVKWPPWNSAWDAFVARF